MSRYEDEWQGMWSDSFIMPILDERGKVQNVVVMGFDITERKKMEQELLRRENENRALINAIPDLLFRYDRTGTFLSYYAKPGIETYVPPERFLGKRVREVLPAEAAAAVERAIDAVLGSHQEVTIPFMLEKRGVLRSYEARFTAISPDEVLCISRDVTELLQAEEQLRQYGRRLVELEEEQRRKLATVLHDRIGPDLSALGMNFAVILQDLSEESRQRLWGPLSGAKELIDGMAQNLRGIMADLRPPVLDDYGLSAALRWYAGMVEAQRGMRIAVAVDHALPRLPVEKELVLFRIVQEALTNVAKHAGGSEVSLSLGGVDGKLLLTVADAGAGFDPGGKRPLPSGTGWGLTIMQERAASIGAVFRIESEPGQGTTVSIELEGLPA